MCSKSKHWIYCSGSTPTLLVHMHFFFLWNLIYPHPFVFIISHITPLWSLSSSSSPRHSSETHTCTFLSILQCQRLLLWRLKREGLQLMENHLQVLSIGAFMLKMLSWKFLLIWNHLGISSGLKHTFLYFSFTKYYILISHTLQILKSFVFCDALSHFVGKFYLFCCVYDIDQHHNAHIQGISSKYLLTLEGKVSNYSPWWEN